MIQKILKFFGKNCDSFSMCICERKIFNFFSIKVAKNAKFPTYVCRGGNEGKKAGKGQVE
jgi:hypothetical protein